LPIFGSKNAKALYQVLIEYFLGGVAGMCAVLSGNLSLILGKCHHKIVTIMTKKYGHLN
jgi:hypothetical protein